MIIESDNFEVVDSFRYLGDSIDQSESCFEAATDLVRATVKNFHSVLLVLTDSGISLKVRGHAFMPVFVVSCCMLVKLGSLKQMTFTDSSIMTMQ